MGWKNVANAQANDYQSGKFSNNWYVVCECDWCPGDSTGNRSWIKTTMDLARHANFAEHSFQDKMHHGERRQHSNFGMQWREIDTQQSAHVATNTKQDQVSEDIIESAN